MTRDVVVPETESHRRDGPVPDALIGAAAIIAERVTVTGRLVARVAMPGARIVLNPPLVPSRRRPARLVESLVRRGRIERIAAGRALERTVAVLVPAVVTRLIDLLPLTDLIRQNLDLDVLIADVDLDAVAAGIDIDAVAARIDLDAILDRVDLTNLVKDRVDLDAIVGSVDIDAVIDRIDLAALAQEVIAAVDLPEIIRQSSGSLALETVRSVRMQSIEADRAVERVISRLLPRRRLPSDGQSPEDVAT